MSGALREWRLNGPTQLLKLHQLMRLLGIIVLGGPSMSLLVLLFLWFVAGGAYGGVSPLRICFFFASAALGHNVPSLVVFAARSSPVLLSRQGESVFSGVRLEPYCVTMSLATSHPWVAS